MHTKNANQSKERKETERERENKGIVSSASSGFIPPAASPILPGVGVWAWEAR